MAHKPTATAANAYARDGISLTVSGAQTNAGSGYTAEVAQIEGTGADNYTLPEGVTCKFTIVPRVIEAQWGTLTQIYDGDAWNPEATIVNLASQNGVKDTVGITYQVTAQADSALSDGMAIDVGGYTVAIDAITNDNYTIEGAADLSKDFTITQKEIGISWSDNLLTYNGTAQAPTAEARGTYDRDSISLTVGGAQTDAGSGYTAEVTQITGTGAGNYKLPAAVTQSFTIARYQLEKPTAGMNEVVYSGEAQTYTPVGYEEYPVEGGSKALSIAGNVQTNANEAGYAVTVSIADRTNYEWKDGTQDDVGFTFIIQKQEIDLNDI